MLIFKVVFQRDFPDSSPVLSRKVSPEELAVLGATKIFLYVDPIESAVKVI